MSDALASLRIWGVSFVVGEHGFHIPPWPAADWFDAVVSNSLLDLLESGDAERLTDLVADGEVAPAALQRAFADVIAEATGREWHIGVRLMSLLFQDDLRGEVMSVIDPQTRPLAAVLDVIYATCVRWKTSEERTEFDARIFAPPDSAPGSSDPRERARQMREQSKRLLAEQEGVSTDEASDTPSDETPPTSD